MPYSELRRTLVSREGLPSPLWGWKVQPQLHTIYQITVHLCLPVFKGQMKSLLLAHHDLARFGEQSYSLPFIISSLFFHLGSKRLNLYLDISFQGSPLKIILRLGIVILMPYALKTLRLMALMKSQQHTGDNIILLV